MIGIYKITKIENGKSYIGQSNDIERRFSEHKTKINIPIEIAIRKYGVDSFTFEVIEECSLDQLDEREQYWISFYNTYKGIGYNCNEGGGNSRGENNGRTKLTNEDVAYIRECYDSHMRRRDVYQKFQDKISFDGFASIWDGRTWKDIKMEVYTEENKKFYTKQSTNGEKSSNAVFSNEEVLNLRKLYVDKSAKFLYNNYKDRISFDGFQKMLWGHTYKDVDLYLKKKRRWINGGTY